MGPCGPGLLRGRGKKGQPALQKQEAGPLGAFLGTRGWKAGSPNNPWVRKKSVARPAPGDSGVVWPQPCPSTRQTGTHHQLERRVGGQLLRGTGERSWGGERWSSKTGGQHRIPPGLQFQLSPTGLRDAQADGSGAHPRPARRGVV